MPFSCCRSCADAANFRLADPGESGFRGCAKREPMTQMLQAPTQPGEAAPDFAVSAVQTDGTISLADYRSRAPLLLGLFTGLYCPFCRRAIAQMAATSEKLKPLGVESLA